MLKIDCSEPNRRLIKSMTIIKTMISPVKVTSVAISSLSDFFKSWLITAVIIPIAAILKIIPISMATPFLPRWNMKRTLLLVVCNVLIKF